MTWKVTPCMNLYKRYWTLNSAYDNSIPFVQKNMYHVVRYPNYNTIFEVRNVRSLCQIETKASSIKLILYWELI